MGRGGGMQEVELLDGPADDDAPDPGRSAAAAGRTRARRRWLLAGAATLAVTLGVVQWVTVARESAALERLSQVPGVLAPIDARLDVVRRVPSTQIGTLFGFNGGQLMTAEDGSQTYTWDDPAVGGPGWTTELLGPHDTTAVGEMAFGGTSCQPDVEPGTDVGTAQRIVCLVTDGGMLTDADGHLTEEVPGTTRQVVVLSTADGAIEARWPLERGQSFALLPGDLVVVASATGGIGTITAFDVLAGTERWTHAEPPPVPSEDATGGGLGVSRVGELVVASTPSGHLTLLSADGAVVRDDFSDLGEFAGGWTTDSMEYRLQFQKLGLDGTTRSTVLAADGNPAGDVTVDGQLVNASVDDGSVPGLLLSSFGTALHGWDADTGAARWSDDSYVTGNALIVRGRVYAATGRGVVALDGRTGARLWGGEDPAFRSTGALFTDGRHVIAETRTSATGAAPELVAFDPVTGDEAFRARYPEGISPMGEADGHLLGHDEATDEYVLLR